MVLAGLPAAARADRTLLVQVENSCDSDMLAWDKTFTLPKDGRIIKTSAHRWNPNTRQWVDESTSWTGTVTQNPAGTWHVTMVNDEGAPVGKGVIMGFDVKFNTNSTGVVRGDSRIYVELPVGPKRGQKEAEHKGGGAPPAPVGKLDSGVFYGGSSGSSVPGLGLTVPPNTYAYVYQIFVRPGSPNVTYFQLPSVANRFSSFVQKSFTHNGAVDSSFLSVGDEPFPDPKTGVFDSSSVAVFESAGGAGVPALSWGPEGSDVYARFTGLSGGQSSNVLVGMSPFPPDHVGITDNEFLGTAFTSDGNRVLAPNIPPSAPGMGRWGRVLAALMLLGAGAHMLRTRTSARSTA
jgi:hypothetical protein